MANLTAKIAERKPEEQALHDERGSTTWAALDGRVNRLIHAFRDRGLQQGDTIAVMSGNRRESFELTLAYMHAGWIGVPVNWHWTAEELAYVLADSGAKALVVEDQFLPVAIEATASNSDCSLRVVIGSEIGETDPSASGTFLSYEAMLESSSSEEPTDQCTGGPMFYTSGTTGFPKGVKSALTKVGQDIGMWELIAGSFAGMLGAPVDGITLLEGPAYHSAQWVFSVFPLIGSASTLVMRHRFDAAETLALIDAHQITTVHLVPTQFIRLLKLPDDVRASFSGTSLQAVFHGAAPCSPSVKRDMLSWWGPVVSEYYGGTEGGFLSLISGDEWLAKPGSLGRPLPIVDIKVFDDDGNECGAGLAGQIWFKSVMGNDFEYHNAPEKTAAAHTTEGYGTLGDIGYFDADGFLFMSDRKIDMIISGGVNIYPAEIEGVLVTHPAVADAAVFGVPDDEFGEQVKAAIQVVDGHEADTALEADLIDLVRTKLAGYKAPRSIDFHPQLPRTPTGKLLKRKLRDPYWESAGRSI